MDFARFQMMYPELIISHDRCGWFGENLEYYNFVMRSWHKMAPGAFALLFEEKKVSFEEIDGVIKSAGILEPVDVALTCVKEGVNSYVGLVRGKNVRREGEESFEFGDFGEFSWSGSESQIQSDNFEAPSFFDPEEDLRRELGNG